MSYSKLSIELTNKISKTNKKNNGIYFTPPLCVQYNIEFLTKYINKKNLKVLEPSCGSCEYILPLYNKFKNNNINITGIELNSTIFDSIKHLNNQYIKLINNDFLTFNFNTKYDLIIGNPPFYVVLKKNVHKKYYKYFDGRPNIYILFIIKCLKLLNENGILSFILPKNFLNCFYYNNLRKYIFQKFQILLIKSCTEKYIETCQETIMFILQKTNNSIDNSQFIIKLNKIIAFGTSNNITNINKILTDYKTLDQLGFEVNVGNVVWNQCKNILTNDNTKTRLIYNSDIKNNTLKLTSFKNNNKKNYIKKKGNNKPLLVINRGYGKGKYIFNYCLINVDFNYLIENHLICIKYKNDIDDKQLIQLYMKIISSLNNEKTNIFINNYFGNNAINTKELNFILPIYNVN